MKAHRQGSMQRAHRDARWRRFWSTSPRRRFQIVANRLERRAHLGRIGSGPLRLDLVPTYRCNLNCIGCAKHRIDNPTDFPLDLFREILAETAGWLVQFRFCSQGEPLLCPTIFEMLSLAADRGIGSTLQTNGTLLDAERADFLINRARLDALTFSIDGAEATTCSSIRRGLDFDKLLEGITLAAEAKRRRGGRTPALQANFVAMRDNIGELPDLVRLARKVGIEDLNVNYLSVEGDTTLSQSLWHAPQLAREVFEEAARVAVEQGIVLHLPPFIDQEVSNLRCFFPWDTMIIDTGGSVRLCYFAWQETIGNVRTEGGVRAVWNNEIFRRVRKTIDTDRPFYSYCAHCGRRCGFSRVEAHLGTGPEREALFRFHRPQDATPAR